MHPKNRNTIHMRKKLLNFWLLIGFVLYPLYSFGEIQSIIPIVKLQYSALSKDTFSSASFSFIYGEDTLSLPAAVRHRGATSTKYQKKSYAIKLYDENGQKKDTSLFGMRSDNYWILEAMASDKARMRNRVAMDLWLDFSQKPSYIDAEPKVCNGYNGKFVEVYVNDTYNGIYCLMERVDRKQLKLKKAKNTTINGVLYKAVKNTPSFFGELSPYDNNSTTWMRYEYEYPDVEDGFGLINWEPLYDAMNFANTASVEDFVNEAPERYDIPVFRDYYLFTVLLSARDNRGKNLYLSFYNINQNSKLLLTPWDIDHSFGRMYNSDEEAPETECTWNASIYNRLKSDMPDYYPLLLSRYAELRKNYFSLASLRQRFTDYFDLFFTSGAYQRETERWNGIDNIDLDFIYEEEYIDTWLEQRLAYTDALFNYKNISTEMENNIRSTNSQLILRNGQIYILRNNTIYSLSGQIVSK